MKPLLQLVLLRHGQTLWNKQHRSTGWADVGLTEAGERQAREAGRALAAAGFQFDTFYSSQLHRAKATMEIVKSEMRCDASSILERWRLNERHIGAFEGLGPFAVVSKYGLRRFIQCQLCYDVSPPPLALDDARFPGNQERFAGIEAENWPRAESMKQTWLRVRPFWEGEIVPALRSRRRLLIVSHKNTLRLLLEAITGRPASFFDMLSVRACKPLVFELDDDLRPLRGYVVKRSPNG
ncbi:MAG: phosphoglyceromutase [Legionellales bacterium]|nr:phosphoglyceromutase [Legionellales bacterium]HCU90768.1 phosphoglyceromutase [Gammaproteobacteria bacterium]|tara:strand:- start:1638 stop:2351 length:714 start_codon:yes stop_codon:yes gene_type:complete